MLVLLRTRCKLSCIITLCKMNDLEEYMIVYVIKDMWDWDDDNI